jgi:hypothetical protein
MMILLMYLFRSENPLLKLRIGILILVAKSPTHNYYMEVVLFE